MRNPRMILRSATGIAVTVVIDVFVFVAFATASSRTEKVSTAVDAEQYADFMEREAYDLEDLAEGAEIQRRMFNRMTPPGFAWLQPMFPSVMPFDAANFAESFLDGLLGEDKNSVAIYPLSLVLDPNTRETLVYNAEGRLIATVPAEKTSHVWPVGSDPARVTLLLELLPSEDVEPFLYVKERITESLTALTSKFMTPKSGGFAMKSLGSTNFGIYDIQKLTNGNMQVTVTNGGSVAEIFSYTVLHSASNVVSSNGTNTIWSPISPPFNGLESEWECRTNNLLLTNGVGIWEDTNISSNDRVRFYAAAKYGDADEDDLTGGTEIFLYATDPNNADSDGDDLLDGQEVIDIGTDPNNSDTDGDGLPDGWEVQNELDPHDDGTTNAVNGAEGDLDGDGFNNALEYELEAPANNPARNGAELAYKLTHAHSAARSTNHPMVGMRVDIEDSGNCGGSNSTTQNVTDVLAVPDLLAWGYFIDVTVEGAVEDQNEGYDIVTMEAFTNTYFFEGNENHNGCNMATKTVTQNILVLPNSTVRLRYNTVRYMYHVDAYAEIIDATPTGYIRSLTKAIIPTNRWRTEVGVAEQVDIAINPDPGGVTWSVSGGGTLDTTNGPDVEFIAPSNAATCPVTINFLGHSITKNFGVVEPSGVVNADIYTTISLALGTSGAWMHLKPVVVGPTNVSFYRVQCVEVGQNAINCTGYWLTNGAPAHNNSNGANQWFDLDEANHWPPTWDNAAMTGIPQPWLNGGSFEWPIPAQWRIKNSVSSNSMTGWNQQFDLQGNGTLTISKFGKWVTRTTNNIITTN